MKTGPVQLLLFLEAQPALCHLDRRSHGPSATQGDENGSCSATTVPENAVLPFVLSTGGPPKVMKNSFCSATTLAGKRRPPLCHLDRGSQGPSATQGDEKRVLFSNYCCWKRRPPLCHLDRSSHGPSAHPRRRPPLCHVDRRSHGPSAHPRR